MFSIKFSVTKHVLINDEAENVFKVISNFETWSHWSPWLCQEKECPIERGGDASTVGHYQSWDGKRIGQGKMTLESLEGKSRLHYDLSILRPWKSKSKVSFLLEERGSQTQVSWTMDGSLPVFLFFMKKMMIALIGGDYERGLVMLKEYIEEGVVKTDVELNGVIKKPGHYFLGIKHDTTIEEMPSVMSSDFQKLGELIEQDQISEEPAAYLSYYHDYDIVKGTCSFTSAVAFKEKPKNDLNLESGSFVDHDCIQVIHTGSYNHLGNAWAAVMNYQRCEKLKSNKKVPWYEIYINDPRNTEPAQLKTEINIPVNI